MDRIRSDEPHSYADFDIDYQREHREERREVNPYYRGRQDYDTTEWLLNEKMPLFLIVGFVALIAWVISALIKLVLPAKWAVATWLFGAIAFIGKWVFLICVALIIIIYIANFIARLSKRFRREDDN